MTTRFEPKKINLNRINGGIAYQDGDTPQPNLFNDVAQNAAYCAEQIEGILHPPEVVETDPNLPPSVEWVQTFVNGRAYQKLRFSNLKGAPSGEQSGGGSANISDIDHDTIIRNGDGKLAVNVARVTANGVPKDLSNIQQVSDTEIATDAQRDMGMLYVSLNGQPRKISISQIASAQQPQVSAEKSYIRLFTKNDFVKMGENYVLSIPSVEHGITNPYLAQFLIDENSGGNASESYKVSAVCSSRVLSSKTVRVTITLDLSKYAEYSGKIYLKGE